jgi:hypothetical protein
MHRLFSQWRNLALDVDGIVSKSVDFEKFKSFTSLTAEDLDDVACQVFVIHSQEFSLLCTAFIR